MNVEQIEQTFLVPLPAQLWLSNLRGRVVVVAEDSNAENAPASISVSAAKYLDSGDPEQTKVVMRQDADGRVVIQTEHATIDEQGFHKPCRVEYHLRVPRQCSATLSCISCKLEISGLQGEFWLKSISGEMILKDLDGPIEASNVSGAILGERLLGKGSFETTSGEMHLSQCSFPTLKITSVSGDLIVQTEPGPGPYRFKSISGDMTLILPELSSYRAELRSLSGQLLAPGSPAHGRTLIGQRSVEAGSGGPLIQAESISGNLYLPGKPPGES